MFLPEESSNSSRGYSHFCRKEKRGSKEFQVVALSGGCVFLEARSWPEFHLFGPLHQYGCCRFQLLPLTITYTKIMTILQPFKACNLATPTSRCSQTLTPTNGVRNSQEPGCARIPGPSQCTGDADNRDSGSTAGYSELFWTAKNEAEAKDIYETRSLGPRLLAGGPSVFAIE